MSLEVSVSKKLAKDEGSCQDCRAAFRIYTPSVKKTIEHVYILNVFRADEGRVTWGLVNLRLCNDCMDGFKKQFNKMMENFDGTERTEMATKTD